MEQEDRRPGWHGKLPSLGDFASRRLDRDFLDLWDGWLAEGILDLRERLGPAWLDAYLSSPSWRFLLMPQGLQGPPGDQAWAGVLMPSVDRVGRYFPFTVVQPLGDGLVSTLQMPVLWQWLGRLDDLAADALHEDWDVDRLEQELAQMAVPDWAAVKVMPADEDMANRDGPTAIELDAGQGPADWIGQRAHESWLSRESGTTYWYASAEQGTPRLLRSRGLPAPSNMIELFCGSLP